MTTKPTTSTAAPAPAPTDLAKAAYAAYGDAVGGLNYMGLPVPPWHELPTKIVDGWLAAVRAVAEGLAPPEAP